MVIDSVRRLNRFISTGKHGAVWGWYYQFASALSGLVAIPILTAHLGPKIIGWWISLWSLLNIAMHADLGLGLVLSRQIAFARSEGVVSERLKEGNGLHLEWKGLSGINQAYGVVRRLNYLLCSLTLLILVGVGSSVALLRRPENVSSKDLFATVLSGLLAVMLNFWAKPEHSVLEGMGYIGVSRAILGTTLLIAIGLQITLTHWYHTLAAVSFPFVVGALLSAIAAYSFSHRICPGLRALPSSKKDRRRILSVSVPLGALNISGFLYSSIQVPLIGLGIDPTLALQVFFVQRVGQAINLAVMQMIMPLMPEFTKRLGAGQSFSALKFARNAIVASTAAFALANIGFICIYYPACAWKLGTPMAFSIVGVFAIDYWISNVTTTAGQIVIAAGRNPFVASVLVTGALNVGLLLFLVPRIGPMAVPLSTLLAGLFASYTKNVIEYVKLVKFLQNPA